MAAALPFTSLVYLVVCGIWLNATLSLARTMEETEEEKTVSAADGEQHLGLSELHIIAWDIST
jgi:hypothetical protein